MFLYTELLYRPLLNALFFLYNALPIHDMGLAIILLTVFVKLLLLAPTLKTVRAQSRLVSLQPKVEALKKQFSDNKEQLAKALMELYKQEKVNPLSSCLPLLLQLPFLLALYHVFQAGLVVPSNGTLYAFITQPESISPLMLGFMNLAKPNLILVAITAAAQYIQTKMMPTNLVPASVGSAGSDERTASLMNRQMQFLGPGLTFIIGFSIPSALILYWLVSTVFQVGIQWYGMRGAVRK